MMRHSITFRTGIATKSLPPTIAAYSQTYVPLRSMEVQAGNGSIAQEGSR